ncbi:Leucine-rich repeat-containing protein 56 [Microtus ochrogaster]|uniref:Leucine-rich repeat-containing protein 56 n=1 Tax=Microtus ochrogaster TaxID=79684 RepID=A0A8J6GCX0_MICOH|nr:Leucine-rich repeat-containing protein 56 [Microtus ochrogaster]
MDAGLGARVHVSSGARAQLGRCGQQADSPLGACQSPSRPPWRLLRVFTAFSSPACLPYSGEPPHRICRVSRQPLLGGGAHLAAAPDARGLRIFGYSNETPPPLPWRQGRNPSAVEKRKPSFKRATAAVEGPRDAPRTWAPWPTPQQALAQVDDLQLVRVLEMCVDTRKNSLGNFGVHLPNLIQLKLNHSCLGSLRDLGTSLGHLQVLWLARCGLTDLDGIGSFLALKELYVSYNNISDLSPLCLLEQLEVLDLEGNNVEDLGQMRYLQLCPRLATLTLEGNLVCLKPDPGPSNKAPQDYNYRAEVKKLIPQLHILDEIPTTCTNLPASQKLNQDWLMVKEAIKEGSVLDILLPRLGACQVLCGNPTKGLRERRQQYQEWAPLEQLPSHRPDLATHPSTPRPDPTESCDLAMIGLRAWREPGLRLVSLTLPTLPPFALS